jgi:hypothetical protein
MDNYWGTRCLESMFVYYRDMCGEDSQKWPPWARLQENAMCVLEKGHYGRHKWVSDSKAFPAFRNNSPVD